MSRGLNKVMLIGRLGQNVEVKQLQSGAVANISLATSESWKDKTTGEKKEKTEWHRVTFFGRLAEIAGEYLAKGSQIYVEGRLQTRKYEKNGADHYATEIIASEMQMLDSKRDSAVRTETQASQPAAAQESASPETFDDDIPF